MSKENETKYKPLSKRTKNKYPIGTRIKYLGRKLYKVDDAGATGTVTGYGEYVPLIYVDWDNNSYNLPIYPEIDKIEIIKPEKEETSS